MPFATPLTGILFHPNNRPPLENAWVFGTPAERARGGFPGIILWDIVLPYERLDPAFVSWFRDKDEEGDDQRGVFPGANDSDDNPTDYHRNMAEGGGSASNFPDSRQFNAVFLRTNGLTQIDYAVHPDYPPRRLDAYDPYADPPLDDLVNWPFAVDTVVTDSTYNLRPKLSQALGTYFVAFLDTTTYFMVEFGERDVIAWMDEDDDLHDAAEAAIDELIAFILSPSTLGPDSQPVAPRLLAWYTVHEPEIPSASHQKLFHLPGEGFKHDLVALYDYIREREQYWRAVYDSPGYGALPDEEQKELLRPIALTLSSAFAASNGGVPPNRGPAAFAACADIFFHDADRWRRPWDDLKQDYLDESPCAASGTNTPTGNFTAGKKVVIGGTEYTFQVVVSSSNDVKLGANLAESLSNLRLAIMVDDGGTGAGDVYGTGTIANTDASATRTLTRLWVKALVPGPSGNSIVFTSDDSASVLDPNSGFLAGGGDFAGSPDTLIPRPGEPGNNWGGVYSDPIISLVLFAQVRDLVRGASSAPKSVIFWSQNHGSPYRPAPVPASSAFAPATPPPVAEDCRHWPDYHRIFLRASARQQRMLGWGAVFEGSEGMAFQTQFLTPDDAIVANLVPISREFEFFQALRWSVVYNNEELAAELDFGGVPVPVHQGGIVLANLPPVCSLFSYPKQPPTPLPRVARWLLLMNRDERKLIAHLTLATKYRYGHDFFELLFPDLELGLNADPSKRYDPSEQMHITVDPFDMRIFALVPRGY